MGHYITKFHMRPLSLYPKSLISDLFLILMTFPCHVAGCLKDIGSKAIFLVSCQTML